MVLGCFVTHTRGVIFYFLTTKDTRVGLKDNIVFVREPGNPFDPSCMKFGLLRDRYVDVFGHFDTGVASINKPIRHWSKIRVSASAYLHTIFT